MKCNENKIEKWNPQCQTHNNQIFIPPPSLSWFTSFFVCFDQVLRYFMFYSVFYLSKFFTFLPIIFAATLLSNSLVLLISFRKLLKDKNWYLLALFTCNLSKSSMWFWIWKVSLSILWKPKMAVCGVNFEKCKESVK